MTYNTRIQLKSDLEENWILVNSSFVPLAGEFIIYAADAKHNYCRLKVGDGSTTIGSLPFIDSGTINGTEVEVVKIDTFSHFPSPGSNDKLYIDLSTNHIYHYDSHNGYSRLSNFTFEVSKTPASKISSWSPGVTTQATVGDNILKIENGLLPSLSYTNIQVVSDIQGA